jgi:serine/threonine-protein kinase
MAGPVNTLEIGDKIDSYRIEAEVARSRMETIYRATDLRDGRPVALKVPDPSMEADPFLLERFRRAASIGEKLSHQGVMRVFSEVERSRVYMVMEWCDGKPLRDLLKAGKIPPNRAIRIAVNVLDALQYLHDNGVVHRAIAPDCVMVDAEDKIKLIDFGKASDATARRLTFTNLADELGTVDYISPEQVAGKRGDNRSDIFAMGVILYEMITGQLPFKGSTPVAAMKARISDQPTPPKVLAPTVPAQLQEVIYRALEKDPKNRYARAHDFSHDLQHLEGVGIEKRPELKDWKKGKGKLPKAILLYLFLLLIPIAILIAMVLIPHGK